MKISIRFVKILAAIILTAATIHAGGKTAGGSVTGCLTDADSGTPVCDAWVVILETNQGARTDSSGCFIINAVAPAVYHLAITHAHYGTVKGRPELEITVGAGQAASISLSLRSKIKSDADTVEKNKGLLDRAADWLGLSDKNELRQGAASGEPGPDYSSGIIAAPQIGGLPRHPPDQSYRPDYSDAMPPSDMYFQDYGTNGFVDTRRDRLSTFALDVDDASYNLARRYLLEGLMPPTDAIRVEEFINHFDYGYNVPNDETFRVFTEITDSPFEYDRQVLKVAVKGREIQRFQRKPMNITFVIDVSGSMAWGNRFALVRESIKTLVRQLNSRDRVGMVAYGSQAFVVFDPIPADRHREIFAATDHLTPGGSTYAEAGIRSGYEMAGRQFVNGHNNVIILCSDGVANVGRTSPDDIMREVRRFATRGITMSTFGYGMGNYNDVLLEQLAVKGNGRYAYINGSDDINSTFVDGFVGTLQVLARDVKVQVEFNPNAVKAYRLLGYENRAVADNRFRDNRQDGGEVGAGHEVTAVYELTMNHGRKKAPIATVHVRWKNAEGTQVFELAREANRREHFSSFDNARPELRLAVVAGRFAEMLKETRYAAGTSYEMLYELAVPLRHQLPGEQTEGLLDLIRRAGNLSSRQAEYEDDDNYFGDYNYKR